MSPLRRYLRITAYSVLELRIYLDNPADAHSWLLPILPRVIAAVRPLVLPKLREENAAAANARGKGKAKARGWKDVVVEDEFEVAVFLTETSTRHSILRKEKSVKGEKGRLGTTHGRLTGTRDAPVEVGEGATASALVRKESDESQSGLHLADLPAAGQLDGGEIPKEEEELFVSDASADEGFQVQKTPGRRKRKRADASPAEDGDDKKKLALNTTYDGFSIYGRILCLVVKRRGAAKAKDVTGSGEGQAMMEEWITSTQMQEGQMMDE